MSRVLASRIFAQLEYTCVEQLVSVRCNSQEPIQAKSNYRVIRIKSLGPTEFDVREVYCSTNDIGTRHWYNYYSSRRLIEPPWYRTFWFH